jgi:lysozyme
LLKEQLGDTRDDFLAKHTDLWLAQYTDGEPSWPSATYPHWTLWQYAESGQVDGIDGSEVDLNRFDGSDTELVRWITPPKPKPKKKPRATVSKARKPSAVRGRRQGARAVGRRVVSGNGRSRPSKT